VNTPIEPQRPENEPFPPRLAGRKPAIFDTIFLGSEGVRAGWRAGLFVSLTLVLLTTLQLLAAAVGLPLGLNPRDLTPGPLLIQEIMLFACALVAAAALGLAEGRSVSSYGLPWRRAFRGHFWQGALWGFGEISFLVLLIAALGGFSLNEMVLSGGPALVSAGWWAAAFLMVGLAEEFAFRGYLLTTLSSGMGFWPASVVLSLFFGAVHLGNPGETWMGVVTVAVVGMFFCLTVRRTGDLWFATGAHAAHDFGQAFVYSVPNSGTLIRDPLFDASVEGPAWLTGGAAGPEGSALAFVVLALLFVLFAGIYPPAAGRSE
jgi:membrane protease YdiL (CAAX protease family)